ncbi:hypothetical protein GmHk_12G034610 [Glycine max]|nr:hypothetical protein GmHk_12G034610 [Glycine max]
MIKTLGPSTERLSEYPLSELGALSTGRDKRLAERADDALSAYEKVKNRTNNLDTSKAEIKSAQRKSKERREEESKHKFYTGSATTCAYIQSSSNLLRFPFLVKILYKQRATKDVPSLVLFEQPSRCTLYLKRTTKDVSSLVLTIITKKLPVSYTEFLDEGEGKEAEKNRRITQFLFLQNFPFFKD